MGQVRGNMGALLRLRRTLRAAASPEFFAQLARGLGAAALKQFNDGFRKSRDPYGKPWKPLVLRRGKPLLDTGRMRASAAIVPRPTGFDLVVTANYASVHQEGKANIRPVRARMLSWKVRGKKKRFFAKSVTIPRRMMVPIQSKGLGPIWGPALRKEAIKQQRAFFRRGAGV